MRNKNISPYAKLIYAYLVSFAGDKGMAFPSQSLMCEELGLSRNTIKKYLNELREVGLIELEKHIKPWDKENKQDDK